MEHRPESADCALTTMAVAESVKRHKIARRAVESGLFIHLSP
jgi:hypothetical protein